MRLRTITVVLLGLLAATSAYGQRHKLSVGDAAPSLDIETWVKGEPVKIEKDHVYVIEFWATWCLPCRQSMPHLTELQEVYGGKGLTVVGISSEDPEVVQNWFKTNGSKMGYTVAVDRRNGTERAWLKAAQLKGIPAAFVVDKQSKIAFIGNPHPGADGPEMERILKRVLRGRYDPALEKRAAPVLAEARSARKTNTWRVALMQYDKVIELNPTVFADVALERFEMMLVDMDDPKAAYTYARGKLMGEYFNGDAGALRMLAEEIATDPKIDKADRDLDLALQAAEAAVRVDNGTDPEDLATVALIRFHRGELDQAIDLQQQAWMLALPRDKGPLHRVLRTYQEAAQRSAGLRRPSEP